MSWKKKINFFYSRMIDIRDDMILIKKLRKKYRMHMCVYMVNRKFNVLRIKNHVS